MTEEEKLKKIPTKNRFIKSSTNNLDITILSPRAETIKSYFSKDTEKILPAFNSFLMEKVEFLHVTPMKSSSSFEGLMTITINPEDFKDEQTLQIIITHEMSHFYWSEFSKNIFYRGNKIIYNRFQSLMGTLRGHTELFDESTYLKNVSWDFGHPYDNLHELFASTTTVLKFFPKEFMQKVSKLNIEDQKVHKEVAKFVVEQYVNHPAYKKNPLFDNKILEFLGIKQEEKKKLIQ